MHLHVLHFSTLFFMSALICTACNQKQTGTVIANGDDMQQNTEKDAPYVEGNRKILQWETEEMELFVRRYGWKMEKTGTGMYVQIVQPGQGEYFKEGDPVVMTYKTFLLNGEMVQNSDENGLKRFTVGRSEEITGLHEAALLLKPGAEARLVIPSHLAYGVAGDGARINGRMPIAMTIRVENQ